MSPTKSELLDENFNLPKWHRCQTTVRCSRVLWAEKLCAALDAGGSGHLLLPTRNHGITLTRRFMVYLRNVAYSAVHNHDWARLRITSSRPRLSPPHIALTDLFHHYDLKESAHYAI